MGKFREGVHYKCTSLMHGPTFLSCGKNQSDATLAFANPEKVFLIDEQGDTYRYHPRIVTVKQNCVYECISTKPLVLKGKVYMPWRAMPSAEKRTIEVLSLLLTYSELVCLPLIRRVIVQLYEDEIHAYNTSTAEMRVFLTDKIEKCLNQHMGTIMQEAQYREAQTLWLYLIYPESVAYSIQKLLSSKADIPKISVVWKEGECPIPVVLNKVQLQSYVYNLCLPLTGGVPDDSITEVED